MLEYPIAQLVFLGLVAGVVGMVLIMLARMLRGVSTATARGRGHLAFVRKTIRHPSTVD